MALPQTSQPGGLGVAQGVYAKALCQLFAGSHCAAVIPNRMMKTLSREEIAAKTLSPQIYYVHELQSSSECLLVTNGTGSEQSIEFGCHGDGNSMEACPEQGRMPTARMETCLVCYHVISGTHESAQRTVFSNLKLVRARCSFPEDEV